MLQTIPPLSLIAKGYFEATLAGGRHLSAPTQHGLGSNRYRDRGLMSDDGAAMLTSMTAYHVVSGSVDSTWW
jgi:hypothetical protein